MVVHDIVLPVGWTGLSGGPMFNNTLLDQGNGYVDSQVNWPYALWAFKARYVRSFFESNSNLSFDAIYNFFLCRQGSGYAFKVDDPHDNTDALRGGSGVVETINGVLQLTKHYTDGVITYKRIITRPKTVVLGGGSAGGTVSATTGIVTGASAGTWTGGFWIPMMLTDAAMNYDVGPDGVVNWFDVNLREIRI